MCIFTSDKDIPGHVRLTTRTLQYLIIPLLSAALLVVGTVHISSPLDAYDHNADGFHHFENLRDSCSSVLQLEMTIPQHLNLKLIRNHTCAQIQ